MFKGLGCNEGDGEPFFRIQLVDVVSQVTTDWKGYSFEETKLDVTRQTSWWNDLLHPTTNSKHYTRLMTVKDSGRPSLDTSVLFTSTVTEGSQ